LHDIVEDTEVTIGMILDEFGWRIAEIVDRLTRDRPNGTKLSVEEILKNAYDKKDNEVLLIKLIDRLHNIQTIGYKAQEKQKKQLTQTIKSFLIPAIYLDKREVESQIYKLCKELNFQLDSALTLADQKQFCYENFASYHLPKIENNLPLP
jgi:(p)ppGpp synthase/HD superfamily hydrolase